MSKNYSDYKQYLRLTRDGRFERTDIWREGKWLDLWSVVHFLSGISLAGAITLLHFGAFASIIIALLLLIGYEMWEAMVKIEETPQNRFMDVIVGMTSFVPAYFLAPMLSLSHLILIFGLLFTANVVLATFGWLASRKADELEQRLRADLLKRRNQFLEARHRRRARHLERQ